jgi:uroporphyrinogen decarboxylase
MAFQGQAPERTPVAVFSMGEWAVAGVGESFDGAATSARRVADVFLWGQRVTGSDMVFSGASFNNYLAAAFGAGLTIAGADPPSVSRPAITGPDDLPRLTADIVHSNPILQALREAALILYAELGDDAAVAFNCWAPFTLAGQLYGLDRLMVACAEEPEFASALIDICAELTIAHMAPALAAGKIQLVNFSDPMASGNLISRRMYQRYAVPATAKVIGFARQRGCLSSLHVCGRTIDRLPLMVEAGAVCLSLDTVVDLTEARRIVGQRICLMGNVDPVRVLNEGTPAEVQAASHRAMEAAAGGPFILAPGCDAPATTPLDNLLAMVATGHGT